MSSLVPTVLLTLSALSSIVLGFLVFLRNPRSRTHRAFGILTLDLMFWSLGVLAIIHCRTQQSADFWVRATFCAGAFLPATFFHFILLFPNERLEGPRWLLAFLYLSAAGLAAGAWTPWYLRDVVVSPDMPPKPLYGPVFYHFSLCIGLGMFYAYPNLFRKWRKASGIQRRQIEHVLLGIVLSTFLGSATNVLAPLLEIPAESYGPIFIVLMVAVFSYSMVRYHLLDIWMLFSRTTVHAVSTAFVMIVFLGIIPLVHWGFTSLGTTNKVLPTFFAALVIAFVLQPLRERVQLVLNRTVLKRRYDLHQLLARASTNAAQLVHLDELLKAVCEDIRYTVGVSMIRVLLADEKDPALLVEEYATRWNEDGPLLLEGGALLDHIRKDPRPLLFEELMHTRSVDAYAAISAELARFDAYFCLPLHTSSGLVGALMLGPKTSRDIYTKDDLMVFTALAGPLATAIENARLYRKLEEVSLHRERILSNMRGGVIAVDTAGAVTTVNRWVTEVLAPVEVGQELSRLPARVRDVLLKTLSENRAVKDFETLVQRLDGSEIPVVMSSSCLSSSGAGITGAMVMIFDMSEVRRLQRNVQGAQRLSSLGTLAAGMAHEIKNPLVSIKTFTQLLPTRYDDPDFRATLTEILPHEVERINSIVSRLLDFARPKPVNFAPQNLRKIISDVLALVASQTRKANVEVETHFPCDVMEIYGDEQQLHQVFLNLVLNSVDALKHTTTRRLRVSADYGRMQVRREGADASEEMACVRVEVADTGCGIPQESLENIFTPFYTTKAEGTGLGLSVVHGIVSEHGGKIEIQSGVNEGTRVTVTFPQAAKLALGEYAAVSAPA